MVLSSDTVSRLAQDERRHTRIITPHQNVYLLIGLGDTGNRNNDILVPNQQITKQGEHHFNVNATQQKAASHCEHIYLYVPQTIRYLLHVSTRHNAVHLSIRTLDIERCKATSYSIHYVVYKIIQEYTNAFV